MSSQVFWGCTSLEEVKFLGINEPGGIWSNYQCSCSYDGGAACWPFYCNTKITNIIVPQNYELESGLSTFSEIEVERSLPPV